LRRRVVLKVFLNPTQWVKAEIVLVGTHPVQYPSVAHGWGRANCRFQGNGGIGSSGGFGATRGDNPPSDGIERSLAVFFDTHKNAGEGDPTDNSIGLYTNGDGYFPPRRLAIRNNAPVRLNDGRRHRVRIRYERPFLEVLLDGTKVLVANVELETVVGAKRMAFVGFTASTGEGYQYHDILSWRFTPSSASSQTHVNFEEPRQGEKVESQIRFGAPCILGRTLCTPVDSEVRILAPNRWSVILPVQLPWSTDIPNPSGKAVTIRNQEGTICWKSGALGETRCHGPEGDADGRGRIMFRHRNGKTSFSIDINGDVSTSEGYFSFEVAVPE
ncbi:MAG: L-type lectin-domain containing protein, partial [Acidobacteriota bacterium]